MKPTFLLPLLLAACATVDHDEERYVPETDPLVLERLEQWQNLKFGLLMHWGPYSQWGIVESWSICAEDEGWCRRKTDDYVAYKQEYEKLGETFDPEGFDPERWARAARDAGMKYVVCTTKHHDGFCMFDTKLTDHKITGPDCPFADHPKANVTKEIFDAFRAEGMWTGAYFSKPDWHCEDYWWPNFATPDRNVNYDIDTYPERWERYVQFTHGQILELMSEYGKVDILWLDGGWVAPLTREEVLEYITDPDYKFSRIQSQDIRMGELVAKARAKQPGLIVVDRAVPGPHQNYLTPENRVPEAALPYPWESCIISGGGWSHTPDARYMEPRAVVHMLVDIVAKGGNLLLNVAPGPDGTWQQGAYDLLAEIGAWLDVNGEAIYGTRALPPFKEGDVCLTRGEAGEVYAIHLAAEGEDAPPATIRLSSVAPAEGAKVTFLGAEGELEWKREGRGFVVTLPEAVRSRPPCEHAWTIRISAVR